MRTMSAAIASACGAAVLATILSLAAAGPGFAAQDSAGGAPAAPGCSPLVTALRAAEQMGEAGEADSTVYVGAPGAALLAAYHPRRRSDIVGEGLLVVKIADVDEVVVGIIAADHTMVCDARLLTEAAWDTIEAAALGPLVMAAQPRARAG